MTSLLDKFNNTQMQLLTKSIPIFRPGDDIKVTCNIIDSQNTRLQVFEGTCIAKRNRGLHSSFSVRKVSYGESIICQFFLYSPTLVSIQVIKKGKVRRAKLYYLCNLFGRAARIKERNTCIKKSQ
ncbi:50S ribosomal protein L19 [Wolbachia endosymbiont of Howardula sp.]|uniref:50S ribosomal protein L19 n=1 Tax=Wolbachia endosymbiont of Howardula sp. TaxID=2916816 RepID=UPI00217D8522|nr:50S ribosomal protein L19 [Wolbachia endosymbiont of Howardula sp.]UWI83202.1 50S ribosomal protein L19 [Wolbachia endosymbiont of Howardula sp.]